MGTFNATFPTDGSNIAGEGVFDQTSQLNTFKEGYGPVTANTNGSSQALAVGLKVSATNVSVSGGPTNAGADSSLTFSSQVKHWSMQNNSSINVYYDFDTAATTGSFVLPPGGQVWWEWPVTVVHVYTASSLSVNTVNGIVLKGRAY